MKAKKFTEMADMSRKEKKQARVLTIKEVEALEMTLMDETEELVDRFAAGAMLFGLYIRSRLSDLKKLRGYFKDVNGTIFLDT